VFEVLLEVSEAVFCCLLVLPPFLELDLVLLPLLAALILDAFEGLGLRDIFAVEELLVFDCCSRDLLPLLLLLLLLLLLELIEEELILKLVFGKGVNELFPALLTNEGLKSVIKLFGNI
jgi:hypothetical protein